MLASLSQLCDLLTYSGDDSLLAAGLHGCGPQQQQQHIGELSALLAAPDPSVQLMAARVLTQAFEQVPSAGAAAVAAGTAEALVGKLLCIEYVDVAEQAVAALERLARLQPLALLPCGGMGALLCFLDFFPVAVQRTALRAVASVCAGPLLPPPPPSPTRAAAAPGGTTGGGGASGSGGSGGPGGVSGGLAVPVADFEAAFLDAGPALTQLVAHGGEGSLVELAALALLRVIQCFVAAAGTCVRACVVVVVVIVSCPNFMLPNPHTHRLIIAPNHTPKHPRPQTATPIAPPRPWRRSARTGSCRPPCSCSRAR